MSKTLKEFKVQFEDNSIFEQMVQEVLSKDADAGKWISDFVKSDNPKFEGKSVEQRKKMALGAYYAKQRNEEVEVVDEALKGDQHKLDKNKNNKIDAHDFKLLRKEDIQALAEGKMDHMSLTHLWHAHAKHTYWADQGYGSGSDNPKHADHAATAIENHVRKHHGNKVADDMVAHSGHHVAHAEYVGGKEAKEVETSAEKLRKKHNIKGDLYGNHEHMNESAIEEGVGEKVKTGLKKFLNKVGGGSDEDQRKRLQKNMGIPQTGKPNHAKYNEEVETVEEGWDDMVKSAKDSVKTGPKPSGGAGKKEGTRYGGSKQTSKPEQEEDKKKVNEAKRPEDDSVPFAPPYNTTSSPEFVKDKSGAIHTPMSRAKNLAQLAMKKMKKELGQKGK